MNILNVLWYISIFLLLIMFWIEIELHKDEIKKRKETKNERR